MFDFTSSPIADVQLNGWDDPDAPAKIRQLLLTAAERLKHKTRASMATSQVGAVTALTETFYNLQALAISAISAGLQAEGVGDTVRVEFTGEQDKYALRIFGLARTGEGETLFGEVTQRVVLPTATEGLRHEFSFHITPSGGRPLWDFGSVVNATATQSTQPTQDNENEN